eukprot:365042-Chlamydomonas_euryale.AAC.1
MDQLPQPAAFATEKKEMKTTCSPSWPPSATTWPEMLLTNARPVPMPTHAWSAISQNCGVCIAWVGVAKGGRGGGGGGH